MGTYISFLRGINVGAHNRMKMADLRALCASLGFENVRTHGQSGNLAFEATGTDASTLGDEIEDAIADEFGYDITVMVRTRAELDAIVDRQPFDEPADENTKLYVTFLSEEPDEERVEALLAARSEAEEFVVSGREVYSRLRKDLLADGRFTDAGKRLGVSTTRRTWTVVERTLELASS